MRVTPKVGVLGLNVFTLKYLLHTLFSLAFLEGVVKIGLETSCLKLFIHNISFFDLYHDLNLTYFIQRFNDHYLNFQFPLLNIMMTKEKNNAPSSSFHIQALH